MSPILVVSIIAAYFVLLLVIARLTAQQGSNAAFFTANRQSPWYLVAFGMLGASLSGVTFISVPGQVGGQGFAYFQMVLGYTVGYAVIALVLLPLYYRLQLISIYGYLEQRFGRLSYRMGAFYFLLSRVVGAAFRLYLVANVLQLILFDAWGVPYAVTVLVTIGLIYLYTFKGGIKTIVWTDTLQTLFMLLAAGITVYLVSQELNLSVGQLPEAIRENGLGKVFHFEDFRSKLYFHKQFWAGAFIALVMTGLDQDMMQKNLTVRTLRGAQTNVLWFTVTLVFVNLLFLSLGALLFMFAHSKGIALPERSDSLYPILATGHFPIGVGVLFLLGLIAAAYSSADSALTALTTSFCVDFLGLDKKEEGPAVRATRQRVHVMFAGILFLVILLFKVINDDAVIAAVFTAAGYTYGPLLGLFAFGGLTRLGLKDRWVPYATLAAPLISYAIKYFTDQVENGYRIGFEILLINAAITFLFLLFISKRRK